ncbi:MAG: amino acid-binding protein [Gammaproteobacteria bacterium]
MQYSIQRQLSIAIENKPGRLATIAGLMAKHGINIRNLCVVDNIEQGMIRLIPSDPLACRELLEKANYFVVEADVLVFILKDNPGQLETVCDALDAAGVNIEYAYGSEDAREEEARIIVKVSNLVEAVKAISELGG